MASRESSQTNVFVPVLLGAGVILSALAFVVERVAAIVAKSVAHHSAARTPFELQPPRGGLLSPVTKTWSPGRARTARPNWVRAGRLVGLVILALSLAVAIDLIADATQSRPSPRAPGSNTVVELRIDQRDTRPPIEGLQRPSPSPVTAHFATTARSLALWPSRAVTCSSSTAQYQP